MAQRCAGKALLSIRNIKAEFAPDLFTSEERDAFRAALFTSEDFAEGARVRREKRPPRFMGRYQLAGAPRGGICASCAGGMQYTGRGQRFLNHREFVFNSHEETLLCIVAREP